MIADRTGNTFSADVMYRGRCLGMITYTGPVRGDLKVQVESRGDSLVVAKLVDVNGYVKKRAQFHLNASQGMLR